MLEAPDAYARWAPVYPPRAHNALMAIEQSAMLEALPEVAGLAVLDLGCGTGRYTRLLATRGARVVSLDRSPEMLARAGPEARRRLRGDARRLPIAAHAFDLVVAGLMVGDVGELDVVVAEIARVLRPGGRAVYSDLHPAGVALGWMRRFVDECGRRWAVRQHLHSLRDHLVLCRRAGLEVERVIEPVVDFDHRHRGCPAVLVVRARRVAGGEGIERGGCPRRARGPA